jgi:S-adenosylmethionine uptake transporter
MQHDPTFKPVAFAITGVGLLTCMDAIIKHLAGSYSTIELMAFRYGSGLLFAAVLFAITRPGWPNRQQWPRHVLRVLVVLVTAGTFFYALGRLPLAEVFVIVFTGPLFMALFGRLMLGERLNPSAGVALAMGFAGMLVIVLTRAEGFRFGAEGPALLAAVVSPIAYALAMVMMRKQTGDEPVERIVLIQPLLGLLAVAPFSLPTLAWPTGSTLWLALLMGLLGTSGSWALAWAFKHAPAHRIGVAEYTGLIWAAGLGYSLFGEVPRMEVWLGAVLIISACLLVIRAPRAVPAAAPAATT